MKPFMLVFSAVLATMAFSPAQADEVTPEEKTRIYKGIWEYNIGLAIEGMQDNFIREACVDKEYDLETPAKEVFRRLEAINYEGETLCALFKNHLRHSLEPIVKAVDTCVPEYYSGLARFVLEAVVHVAKYICEARGETLLEILHPCFTEIDLGDHECVQQIDARINGIMTPDEKQKPMRDEICSAYNDVVAPCFQTTLSKECKTEFTIESVMGLVNSIYKSCAN